MDQLSKRTTRSVPGSTAAPIDGDHVVGFYDDDAELVDAVASFLAPALRGGDAGVIVATPGHRQAFLEALRARGVAVDAGIADGALVVLDAAELLDAFLRDGTTDPDAFREAVGAVIEAAAAGGREVRVYGEMVALLWERGNVTAMIDLEDAWNALAASHPFVLFCAYPLGSFDRAGAAATFREVVARHAEVLPGAGGALPGGGRDAHARLVALLEQELGALRREREQLWRERAELEETLGELRDLDGLRNEFVSMVVHDIQSPATVVTVLLELLRDSWPQMPDGAVADHLATALESIRRIERLTADIMTVARIGSGSFDYELDAIDLVEVVRRAVGDVGGATGRRIALDAPSLPPVVADVDRQLQILTNLLTNAVKFSPDASVVAVTIARDGDRLVVAVRDEGVGIAPDEQARLFQPFSRLRHAGRARGTGLGLHTAKALVEGQGGRIWVDSEAGRGSTFSYSVPLA